ncbi:MAG: hypothetical protein AAGP08_00595 [Pseudomonadota bacterium]
MPPTPRHIVPKPRLLFRPNALLGWSLTPHYGVRVGFRPGEIVQTINSDGWRTVPGAATADRPTLAVYGCSFTYGTGLADDETYTARLQATFPSLTVLNRGIGGHGTVQNLLQLRRDIRQGAVNSALFGIISDHRYRNIPHPVRMQAFLSPQWYRLGVAHVPVVRRDQSGKPRIAYQNLHEPILARGGFNAFLPDDYMVTDATLAVLGEVADLAARHAIPLRFALLDQLDPAFNAAVRARFPDTLDISVPHDTEHAFLPANVHPNVRANVLYADRLHDAVQAMRDQIGGAA